MFKNVLVPTDGSELSAPGQARGADRKRHEGKSDRAHAYPEPQHRCATNTSAPSIS